MSRDIEELIEDLRWLGIHEMQGDPLDIVKENKAKLAKSIAAIIDARVTAAIKEYDRKRNA